MFNLGTIRAIGMLAVVALGIGFLANAQAEDKKVNEVWELPFEEGKAPPKAGPGEIWCLVTKPAEYKTITKTVTTLPETFYYEIVPAKFEMKEETVVVEPEKKIPVVTPAKYETKTVQKLLKEATVRYEIVPATYEWVEEEVQVKSAGETLSVSQASYKTVTEKVLVKEAHKEWHKIDCDEQGVIISRRESKDDCYHLIEVPAQYQTVTKQVLTNDGAESKGTTAAQTQKIKVQKVKTPSEVKKVEVPAEYQTVTVQEMVAPATVTYQTIPAKTAQVKKSVQVAPESQVKRTIPVKTGTVTCQELASPATLVWRKKKGDVVKKYGSIPGDVASK
jgi:hypothetical protein